MKKTIQRDVFKKCAECMNGAVINDGYYGTIACSNGLFSNVVCNRIKATNSTNNKTILIVLESPHIDEFIKMYPLANDCYFQKELHNVINNCKWKKSKPSFTNGNYDIYLMNAIQYQCSLGFNTDYYRDLVFMTLWDFMRNDFENRLSTFLNNNNVALVINLVTLGSHKYITNNNMPSCTNITGTKFNNRFLKQIGSVYANKNIKSLRDLVQQSIAFAFSQPSQRNILPSFAVGNHPSSWHVSRNMKLIQI